MSRRTGSVGRWLVSVTAWALLMGMVAVLLASVAVPRLAGATPYAILSGSMEPSYPAGTLLIVRPTPPQEIGVNQVITFQLHSGQPAVVTHRVMAITFASSGELTFQTKGDANAAPDPDRVRAAQIRGTVWYAIPLLGYATVWLGGSGRVLLVGAVVIGLGGYALAMFVSAYRDRRWPRRLLDRAVLDR